ncbi:PREDICTED: extensin-like [Nelumbo nucifera]|uniref:Extensin-like n=2 Tax=Nelumbo nucifera TaxID=4432 RepID=A0A1U8ACI1_NELNU|nr:PREDICTED: extensin-like [Nelumbo nucifera]XP_010259441.1 PREDICTED: extensin-like [Nelumbo nucifera]DAD38162.1 TPA_asm: hypothetical protein HUJ06_008803 [Nelumbo nucifera]
MVPELEKPRIIEIQVRMDCNGCIHKIKKALQGINGIYEHYIDFPQQKITVVGWADPEKIVKAIKKTRKIATICAHSEPTDPPAQPTEPAPADAQNPPPEDQSPPTEAAPPTEPPKDSPPPENPTPTPEVAPSAVATDAAEAQQPVQVQPSETKDVEEIHVIHHHPHDYGYGYGYGYDGHWNGYPNGYGFRHEAPVYVTHSYNTYKPSPYITEYEYVRSPPRHTRYSRVEHYGEDYQSRGNTAGNNITSMFSDENPNACRIV